MSDVNLTSAICPCCGARIAILGNPSNPNGSGFVKLGGETNKTGAPVKVSKHDLDVATQEMIKDVWGEK